MFLLLFIVFKASNRIVSKTKGFSVFFWTTLSHEVSRHFPTHTSIYVNFENLLYIRCTLADKPLHWWRIRCPVEGGGTKSWIISSRLRPYSNFPKHLRNSCTIPSESGAKSREVFHMHQISDLHLQQKK